MQSMHSLIVDVPLELMGRVTGLGGTQLRQIEAKSGCSCEVVSPAGRPALEIKSGNAAQGQAAKMMIDDLIVQLKYGRPILRSAPGGLPRAPVPVSTAPARVVPQSAAVPNGVAAPVGSAPPRLTVEIPAELVEKVRAECINLKAKSGCTFDVVKDGARTVVQITHPNLMSRCNGRKMLDRFVLGLRGNQPASRAPLAPSMPAQSPGYLRDTTNIASQFMNRTKRDALSGWNAPVAPSNATPRRDQLPEAVKDFYEEHPEVTAMSAADVAAFRKASMDITVRTMGGSSAAIPKPVLKFEHAFRKYPELLTQLTSKFKIPSPIQSQAWPILLKGHDVIGIAQTGTGKTLAFLLPAFIHIVGQRVPRNQREGPTCLVLSPTRELAQQIYEEACRYTYQGIRTACLYGGANRQTQTRALRLGVEIVIATPGRLNELLELGVVTLDYVTYLVLDEADRMLDMGFEPQIRRILRHVRGNRQTVMTSATWPTAVRQLAEHFLRQPVQISIGSLDLSAAISVTQRVRMVRSDEKFAVALNLLQSLGADDKAIVFCGRKLTTDIVAQRFRKAGIPVEAIHGDRQQSEREAALARLKRGAVRVLVATDVASRGIDVPDITVVVNYDFPNNIEEYVHRVGRTGRAGRVGSSYTMMTHEDTRHARGLLDILVKAKQEVPAFLQSLVRGRSGF